MVQNSYSLSVCVWRQGVFSVGEFKVPIIIKIEMQKKCIFKIIDWLNFIVLEKYSEDQILSAFFPEVLNKLFSLFGSNL